MISKVEMEGCKWLMVRLVEEGERCDMTVEDMLHCIPCQAPVPFPLCKYLLSFLATSRLPPSIASRLVLLLCLGREGNPHDGLYSLIIKHIDLDSMREIFLTTVKHEEKGASSITWAVKGNLVVNYCENLADYGREGDIDKVCSILEAFHSSLVTKVDGLDSCCETLVKYFKLAGDVCSDKMVQVVLGRLQHTIAGIIENARNTTTSNTCAYSDCMSVEMIHIIEAIKDSCGVRSRSECCCNGCAHFANIIEQHCGSDVGCGLGMDSVLELDYILLEQSLCGRGSLVIAIGIPIEDIISGFINLMIKVDNGRFGLSGNRSLLPFQEIKVDAFRSCLDYLSYLDKFLHLSSSFLSREGILIGLLEMNSVLASLPLQTISPDHLRRQLLSLLIRSITNSKQSAQLIESIIKYSSVTIRTQDMCNSALSSILASYILDSKHQEELNPPAYVVSIIQSAQTIVIEDAMKQVCDNFFSRKGMLMLSPSVTALFQLFDTCMSSKFSFSDFLSLILTLGDRRMKHFHLAIDMVSLYCYYTGENVSHKFDATQWILNWLNSSSDPLYICEALCALRSRLILRPQSIIYKNINDAISMAESHNPLFTRDEDIHRCVDALLSIKVFASDPQNLHSDLQPIIEAFKLHPQETISTLSHSFPDFFSEIIELGCYEIVQESDKPHLVRLMNAARAANISGSETIVLTGPSKVLRKLLKRNSSSNRFSPLSLKLELAKYFNNPSIIPDLTEFSTLVCTCISMLENLEDLTSCEGVLSGYHIFLLPEIISASYVRILVDNPNDPQKIFNITHFLIQVASQIDWEVTFSLQNCNRLSSILHDCDPPYFIADSLFHLLKQLEAAKSLTDLKALLKWALLDPPRCLHVEQSKISFYSTEFTAIWPQLNDGEHPTLQQVLTWESSSKTKLTQESYYVWLHKQEGMSPDELFKELVIFASPLPPPFLQAFATICNNKQHRDQLMPFIEWFLPKLESFEVEKINYENLCAILSSFPSKSLFYSNSPLLKSFLGLPLINSNQEAICILLNHMERSIMMADLLVHEAMDAMANSLVVLKEDSIISYTKISSACNYYLQHRSLKTGFMESMLSRVFSTEHGESSITAPLAGNIFENFELYGAYGKVWPKPKNLASVAKTGYVPLSSVKRERESAMDRTNEDEETVRKKLKFAKEDLAADVEKDKFTRTRTLSTLAKIGLEASPGSILSTITPRGTNTLLSALFDTEKKVPLESISLQSVAVVSQAEPGDIKDVLPVSNHHKEEAPRTNYDVDAISCEEEEEEEEDGIVLMNN